MLQVPAPGGILGDWLEWMSGNSIEGLISGGIPPLGMRVHGTFSTTGT